MDLQVEIEKPLPFLKMNGLGNDFVIIDGRKNAFVPTKEFLLAVADRKRGVGYDQFIVLKAPKMPEADVALDIYNCDGTKVGMCGNVSRCIGMLMFKELGRKNCKLELSPRVLSVWEDSPGLIAVDIGEPGLDWKDIPLAREVDTLTAPIASGGLFAPCCVNVGNPHSVYFIPDINAIDLSKAGPHLEVDPIFPERCNIEIAQILAPDRIRMRVWERGTGITEACGSGACATLVAAVRRGLSARRATVVLDGGELVIEWRDDQHVLMIGPASFAFSGVISEDFGHDERQT